MSEKRNRANRAIATFVHAQSTSIQISPIPTADQLARYGEVRDDFPDRIMRMAENNQAHRHQLESRVVGGNVRAQLLGQIFAFVISLALIGLGSWLVANDKTCIGLWLIFGDVGTVAAIFIGGKLFQGKERRDRRRELEGGQQRQ